MQKNKMTKTGSVLNVTVKSKKTGKVDEAATKRVRGKNKAFDDAASPGFSVRAMEKVVHSSSKERKKGK